MNINGVEYNLVEVAYRGCHGCAARDNQELCDDLGTACVKVGIWEAVGLDDDHPMWGINEQITGLLEGVGSSEDHEDVIRFLLGTGLPRSTVDRMHKAIVWGDTKEKKDDNT